MFSVVVWLLKVNVRTGEYSTRNTLTRNIGNKVLKDKRRLQFGVRSVGFGKNVSPTLWEIKSTNCAAAVEETKLNCLLLRH